MVFTLILLLVTVTLVNVADVSILSVLVCKGNSTTLYCKQRVNYHKSWIKFRSSTGTKAKLVREKDGKYDFITDGALMVKNIQDIDAGIYRYDCKYNTKCWNDSSHIACNIILEIRPCEIKRVPYGSTVTMVFKTDRPNTDIKKVSWSKMKSKPIHLAINDRMTSEAKTMYCGRLQASLTTLTIPDTRSSDEGVYRCQVEFVQRQNDYAKPRRSYAFHIFIEGSASNITNVTVLPQQPTEGPTSRNDSSLTKYASSTIMTSTAKENKTGEGVILAKKNSAARIDATDCMLYMISSWLMMTKLLMRI